MNNVDIYGYERKRSTISKFIKVEILGNALMGLQNRKK